MFWWVYTQRHMAYTQPRTASVFRVLGTKTTAIKAWEKVCTKILCEEVRTHFSFSCCIYSFQCLWACTCCWGQTRRKRRQCQTPGHNYSSNRVTLQHHSKHKQSIPMSQLIICLDAIIKHWSIIKYMRSLSWTRYSQLRLNHELKNRSLP